MKSATIKNQKGITLIELVVAFVIFAVVSAASYRLFVSQSRAYAVQDQVVEIQQNIRSGMEIMLRDVRMAGFDNDNPSSKIDINAPLVPGDHSITVDYECDDTTRYTVAYWRENPSGRLLRQLIATKDDGTTVAGPQCVLLENVDALNFVYGIDHDAAGNQDGTVDYWEADSTKIGGRRVVAVRFQLTGRPDSINPDIQKVVSPRTLESIVTLRNQCYKH
jgi:type IV pilus assembly protein PilW